MTETDVVVIGAGASGLMAAAEAGRRGRRVRVIDHADRPGRKILISGGGRCNFTNREVGAHHYVSRNPHFCKSALGRFSQHDFLAMVQKHHIAFEERDHGQLFCTRSARDILDMLLSRCGQAGVQMDLGIRVARIDHPGPNRFHIHTEQETYHCGALVVASGGLAMPSSGATPLGYKVAEQFGIKVWPPSAGLVPFTLHPPDLERVAPLAGIALPAEVANQRQRFRENLLFTHRGLSGPAVLQLSLYWQAGETVSINLLPGTDLAEKLKAEQHQHPRRSLKTVLCQYLPQRLVTVMLFGEPLQNPLGSFSHARFRQIADRLQHWTVQPAGTEGYRTAEVTLGGVDCAAISSKTMEARQTPGLYFCGEVLDVTGRLGGYNLQWAWSSGWAAGQYA